jgi:hypothetical protein
MTALVASPTLPVRAIGGLLKLPVALAGEAHGIWDDARAVTRRARAGEDGTQSLSANEMSIAWYIGLAAMAALRVVNWRTALLVAAAHTVERSVHNRAIAELVEGVEAGL